MLAGMKLGVIGCGKMGTALVEGAIRSGAVLAQNIVGIDPVAQAREHFAKATSATTSSELSALHGCDTLLLCTKPNDIATALSALASSAQATPTLAISIAAGVTIGALETVAPSHIRIIRAMPNTPALVGKGAAAFALGSRATAQDAQVAKSLLGAVGLALEVPEKLLNAVTGLSGSGPAYAYLIIEALADGGVRVGLSRQDALALATQTILGAAAMVAETGLHPAALKDMVTSPGGTTIAGLAELEKHGLRSALISAVEAATRRADELGAQ